MCAGADETYAKSVWPLRKATVLANVPGLLRGVEEAWKRGRITAAHVTASLDLVYRSLGYEDANDASLR